MPEPAPHAAGSSARRPSPSRRIGLVLGAGGITGIAWTLGVLDALKRETGWDARTARAISGTSAGAVAAATVARGIPVERLIALAEDPALLADQAQQATGRPMRGRGMPSAWPGSIALGLSGLLTINPARRLTTLAGFLPAGARATDEIRGLTRQAAGHGWPARPKLLINACDYRTGRRVTFGAAGAPAASLADAVAASSAVPGWYEPVTINHRRYIDGGVISFTNADVLGDEDLDAVLVVSPFTSRRLGGVRDALLYGATRRATSARLHQELKGLRDAGKRIAVIEPTPRDLKVMGLNPMEREHSRAVVTVARETTAQRAATVISQLRGSA